MNFIELVLVLWGLHFVADYPLQGTWIATTKSHKDPHPSGYPWYQSLTAHSAIHGLMVGGVTGSAFLGLLETYVHWLIDYSKSEGTISVNVDQLLHLLCKVVWVIVYFTVITP